MALSKTSSDFKKFNNHTIYKLISKLTEASGFIKKDVAIAISYKFQFIFQFSQVFFSVTVIYFIGKMLGDSGKSSLLQVYGADYFSFALVGLAISSYLKAGLVTITVSIPGVREKGKTIDSLISQIDILPTILDYLQIPIPEQYQGKSFRPVIEGQVKAVNEFVFAEYTGGAVPDCYAVRSIRYKCCQEIGSEPFVYDLAEDHGEQKRMTLDSFPSETKVLVENLHKFLRANGSEQMD